MGPVPHFPKREFSGGEGGTDSRDPCPTPPCGGDPVRRWGHGIPDLTEYPISLYFVSSGSVLRTDPGRPGNSL